MPNTILKPIDNLLNRITMFRLMLYFLVVLFVAAVIFCFLEILPYNPWDLIQTAVILIAVSLLTNKIFSVLLKVPTNVESDYITAFILTLIITPGSSLVFLVAVAAIAQASKYILAYKEKHLFNPAAIAVLITFYAMGEGASWWIGGAYILPFVVLGGFLVIRKIQRIDLAVSFTSIALATFAYHNFADAGPITETLLVNSSLSKSMT